MDGALMRSAWARLQDFICKATNTQYPAQRYSFNWDQSSGNASLKLLGNTFRYTAVSEPAGKEGCAREALSRGILHTIIAEAKPMTGRANELTKLASAYGNTNRLPSMEELFPSMLSNNNSNNNYASPSVNDFHHHGSTNNPQPSPYYPSYNGPLPNIPSLIHPAPSTARQRLQLFIADIFGESSPIFEQIDFVQARAGATPWSIILCDKEYTSQYIYMDKEHGQEAAVRVALEKGALSLILKQHEPQPQYHAAAVDLIAKFSNPLGLDPLPPPIGKAPGSRTPVPGQAGSATPLYAQHGAASPYHAAMSVPAVSPYHMPVVQQVPVPMSPYHPTTGMNMNGYVSDGMYAPGIAMPDPYGRGRSASRRHSSRSHSKKRSSSKYRSKSKSSRRSHSHHRSKSTAHHRSKSKSRHASRSRRRSRRRESTASSSGSRSGSRSLSRSRSKSRERSPTESGEEKDSDRRRHGKRKNRDEDRIEDEHAHHSSSRRSYKRRKSRAGSRRGRRSSSKEDEGEYVDEKARKDDGVQNTSNAGEEQSLAHHNTNGFSHGAGDLYHPATQGGHEAGPSQISSISATTAQTTETRNQLIPSLNQEVSKYLDYLLDYLEPQVEEESGANQDTSMHEPFVKEESPEPFTTSTSSTPRYVSHPSATARSSQAQTKEREKEKQRQGLLKTLDSANREKLEVIKMACSFSTTMQNIRSAIGSVDASASAMSLFADQEQTRGQELQQRETLGKDELVLLPRKWVEETLAFLQERPG